MVRHTVHIDLDLPDSDEEAAELIETAERLYPNNPLGVFWLNHLRKLVEEDQRPRDEELWA